MKRLLLIIISLAWLPFIAEQARGCTCTEYGTPVCAAYWRADAVFVGQLRDMTPVVKKSDAEIPTAMLHFIVEQPFRGIAAAQVDIATLFGTSCDMKFTKGKRYLIYASLDRDSKQLFAGPCTRTTELTNADYDLNYIRTVTQQVAKESIEGRLVRNRYEALPGLKITVQSGDKILETTTDGEGDFSVSLPGSGNYIVRAFVPFAAAVMAYSEDEQGKIAATDTLTTFEYEVQIAKQQCHYRQIDVFKIDLHATAELSGNVLTPSSLPINPGWVHLVNAADPDDSRFKQLEENGSFRFEGVAVGEYYLVLNPRNEAPDENDAPYPRTYYPGVAEPGAATRIVVREGAKLENLILRVGRPWKERVVTGTVIWQDGSAGKNAHISLYDGDRYVRRIVLDEKGKFKFKVYGDFKYAITAQSWGRTQGQSERVLITNDKTKGLTLVLKRVE